MPSALITGVSGQDGFFLSRLLLEKGYEVYGLQHKVTPSRNEGTATGLRVIEGDLRDADSLARAVSVAGPDEIYNLGGPSYKPTSIDSPSDALDVVGQGPLRLLEIIRRTKELAGKDVRFFQASSSEMFGRPKEAPQNEETPLRPSNPYAAGKTFAHHLVGAYRETYGIFAVSGICYNHESTRRRPEFVTRRVAIAAAKIALGLETEVLLGDLEAERDWGAAEDFVEGMWLSLQLAEPQDYVFATGQQHSVAQLCEAAFGAVGITEWQKHVRVSSAQARKDDVRNLVGDPSRARRLLGWEPKVPFEALVTSMVEHEKTELQKAGFPLAAPHRTSDLTQSQ